MDGYLKRKFAERRYLRRHFDGNFGQKEEMQNGFPYRKLAERRYDDILMQTKKIRTYKTESFDNNFFFLLSYVE